MDRQLEWSSPKRPGAIKPRCWASRRRSTARARRIANVWEYTQSVIAVLVVATTCTGVFVLSVWHQDVRMPPEWWTIVGLVIGFYFGRTRPSAPAARTGQERDRASDRPREDLTATR